MTTPQERLFEVYESYRKAYERRTQDWKDATTTEQADAIEHNVEALERLYLDAAKAALDANGSKVEEAYVAAKKARENVDKAYEQAKALPAKIRLVGKLTGAVGDLVKKASGS